LEIGMDEEDLNAVRIQHHGNSKIKVEATGISIGAYGTFTVVFEENYYFALSQIKSIKIEGSESDDWLWNDTRIPSTMIGLGGHDLLVGGSGPDYLDAGPGDDLLYGRAGDDDLLAGPGEDGNHGGPGNDILDLGGDSVERFQIGDKNRDQFVRYGHFYGKTFYPMTVEYTLEQSGIDGLPVVTVGEDYSAADGDAVINVNNVID
jgi:hypothetical protein